jgi:integrase
VEHINKPGLITNEDAHAIIARLEEPYATMCLFMLVTGARVSDTVSLEFARVKSRLTLKERKTRKKRIVELPKDLVVRIKDLGGYIYAFESRHRVGWYTPLSRQMVHIRIAEAAKAVGVTASAHSFRHLYARNLYFATGCMETVQKSLLHARTSTTEAYVFS